MTNRPSDLNYNLGLDLQSPSLPTPIHNEPGQLQDCLDSFCLDPSNFNADQSFHRLEALVIDLVSRICLSWLKSTKKLDCIEQIDLGLFS
jgi:hypothetical protein